jgi:hypothetical protein
MRRPVVAVHQPNYLPWTGWFAKAAGADVLVLLDDVQFERGGPTNRVEVKTVKGRTRLTVPVRATDGARILRIDEVEIRGDPRWSRRHVRTLEQSYRRCPGWSRHGDAIAAAIAAETARLVDLNERLARMLLTAFEVRARVVRASELGPREERGSAGIAEICRRVGAATYLSGAGGRRYNDPGLFAAAGIDLVYSNFRHPAYAQPHGAFEQGLSAIDLLFSAPDDAPSLIRSSSATSAG